MNWNWRSMLASAGMFTPKGLVLRAAILAVLYGAVDALGWRESTSILCGTAPGGDPRDAVAILFGVAYVALHFAFVLGVPVLLIAAAILAGAERWVTRQR